MALREIFSGILIYWGSFPLYGLNLRQSIYYTFCAVSYKTVSKCGREISQVCLSIGSALSLLSVYAIWYPKAGITAEQAFRLIVSCSLNHSAGLSHHKVSYMGLRIGVLLFGVPMYILCIAYGGSLMSALTVVLYQPPMNSLSDLVDAVKKVSRF